MYRYRRACLWLTGLCVALAGCGGHYPQTTLAPRSDLGLAIDHLFTGIFGWALGVFIVVEGLLLFTIVKFRARPGAAPPKAIHGHTALEIAWTLAPVLILVFVAVPTVRTIFQTQAPAPAGALEIQVIGHQWWWEYRYPAQGVVTANELHVPVGRPVQLVMTSADVIHSFWAPAVAAKRDVIPGHTNYIVFTADSVGTYTGQCAEYCGDSHANMRLRVMVESDSAFRAWLADQQAPAALPDPKSLPGQGKAVFSRSACIGCHTITGVSAGVVGPNLSHVASRTTIAGGVFPNDSLDLALWIANAPDRKPGSMMMRMNLSPADLQAVVAYLRSLK
ncbi:MAG TPA: cytochrome c oxidase subunit II [Gemmatimonadales bacterium]